MRNMVRRRPSLSHGLMLLAVLLGACGRAAAPTTPASAVCALRVEGHWINDPAGRPAVLHGANLPSLIEMENSAYPADARLRDLAVAGARIVRLAIDESELTPTFVPAKVVPFVQQSNQLGMIVVLSWRATIGNPVNDMVDDAEDWLRLEITYLSNHPGVWFDLYGGMKAEDVPALRQRNIAQRLVDVARGFRANNIIVVNDPIWLLDADPAVNQPLSGINIVYGIGETAPAQAGAGGGYNLEQYPFIVTRAGASAQTIAGTQPLKIGAIARSDGGNLPQTIAALAESWKAHSFDWSACAAR